MTRRAQSSLEFVMLSGAAIFGLALMIVVAQGLLAGAISDRNQASLKAIETAVHDELAYADRAPAGTQRTFSLPASIDGTPYTMVVLPDTPPRSDALIITWHDTQRLSFFPYDVNGSLVPGTNTWTRTASGITVT